MKHITELFAAAAHRVKPPVLVAHGPPWPVANLVKALALPEGEVTCAQFDLHQTERVRETLAEVGAAAEVVAVPDLWDLPPRFNTVVFPASAHADRELKLDVVEQGYHALAPGGLFLTLLPSTRRTASSQSSRRRSSASAGRRRRARTAWRSSAPRPTPATRGGGTR